MIKKKNNPDATSNPFDKEAVAIMAAVGAISSFLVGLWTTKQWDESLASAAVAGVVFLIARFKVYSKVSVKLIKRRAVLEAAAEDLAE